ncbi:RNA polymerase sigma factor [Planctomicrobium sp. SH527]|uniref:RNA polymerase sigma factor n=1 Tax=Planctomicrobium sp. SH527 TaxID=3448123 RepID=UPI003F5C0DF6
MLTDEIIRDFEKITNKWKKFSMTERDEIFSNALLIFHTHNSTKEIEQPLYWLVSTAKKIQFEVLRERKKQHAVDEAARVTCVSKQRLSCNSSNSEAPRRSKVLEKRFANIDTWKKLTAHHRELIIKVYVENLSVSAAAREIGIPRSTAKSWISRDLARLRRDLALQNLVS